MSDVFADLFAGFEWTDVEEKKDDPFADLFADLFAGFEWSTGKQKPQIEDGW